MPATRLFRFQQSGKHIFDFTTKLIDLHSELVQGWTLLCTWKGFFGGLQQFLQQLGNGRCHDLKGSRAWALTLCMSQAEILAVRRQAQEELQEEQVALASGC